MMLEFPVWHYAFVPEVCVQHGQRQQTMGRSQHMNVVGKNSLA